MTLTIALAGKGGVGKTTIAAMIIKYLVENTAGTILAIDADPSSNLNMVLGLNLDSTVGDIREDMLQKVQESTTAGGAAMGSLPGGVAKRDYLDYMIRSAVEEGDRFDLIAMGRSEGSGCYCAVNHNLREVIDIISKNYNYVVIDNEAGMEHLSRRTTRDVDHLIVVSDPTMRGLVAAERIIKIKDELEIDIKHSYLILNRFVGEEIPNELLDKINKMDVEFLGIIPADMELINFEYSGRPLIELNDGSPTYSETSKMISSILKNN